MVFASGSGQSSMVDMNITPLVDVMLVLLVIFMVTVPAVSYSNSIKLPHIGPPVSETVNTETVRLHLTAGGLVEWNGSSVSLAALEQQLSEAAAKGLEGDGRMNAMRQPRIRIDADPDSDYALLAKVLAKTSNAGLQRVVFANIGD